MLSLSSPEVDMSISLPAPKLSTSVVFYKRQMWTYNFGNMNMHQKRIHMYGQSVLL